MCHVLNRLNVLIQVNEFIFSFNLLYSVLGYHGYINVNMGFWWVETIAFYITIIERHGGDWTKYLP